MSEKQVFENLLTLILISSTNQQYLTPVLIANT